MEWFRLPTVLLAFYGIFQYIRFYLKGREPAALAPVSWLIFVIGYSIFKAIVQNDPCYYNASVILNNAILVSGIIMIISALAIYKDYKKNGH